MGWFFPPRILPLESKDFYGQHYLGENIDVQHQFLLALCISKYKIESWLLGREVIRFLSTLSQFFMRCHILNLICWLFKMWVNLKNHQKLKKFKTPQMINWLYWLLHIKYQNNHWLYSACYNLLIICTYFI